jgi:hypothetical protein
VAHAVAVSLHRLVLDAVRGQPGQDVVEVGHAERDHGAAHPCGPHVPVVDDDPRVLADLPQILLADDLVRRPPEEHLEPLLRCRTVTYAHNAVQVHQTRSFQSFRE